MRKKSKLRGRDRIPSPFETTAYKVERSAVAVLMHWMRQIIEQKALDLGLPDVDTSGADGKSPDLIIYESRRSQNVLCVIEAKPPYFDVFDYEDLKKPAWDKANTRGAKYFATTNFKELIWFNTEKVNALKPEEEQVVDKYHISGLENLEQIEETRYKETIIKQLQIFLDKLYAVHTGKEPEPKQAVDEFLIYRLHAKINTLAGYYTTIIDDLCHKDTTFAMGVGKWFVSQGWSFAWQAQDFEKAARQTAYLLVNKILFYNVLQAKRPHDLPPLEIPQGLLRGAQLQKMLQSFFDEVLKIDYDTIYTTDFIDTIAFPDEKEVIKEIKRLIDVLHQYDFSKLSDIIGPIFERLIPQEERHNLGQYFTNNDVVDIILKFCLRHEDDKVLDPACGAGTFLVRAYHHKRLMNQRSRHQDILDTLWGNDIAKFPAHLSTINLAIRDLGVDKNYPNILQEDFFTMLSTEGGFEMPEKWRRARAKTLGVTERQVTYPRWFDCVVGNPPYTRQEEMPEIAPQVKGFKEEIIEKALKDNTGKRIAQISKRAGIHAYFFVHGVKFLKSGGRFGFIVSNSWLDVDYGKGLQNFFLNNYKIVAIIESKVERWFEEADVNTCIVILEKCSGASPEATKQRNDNLVRFVYLFKPLSYFIPPVQDTWQEQLDRLEHVDKLIKTILAHSEVYQNEELRIYPKSQAELWEEGFECSVGSPDPTEGKYMGAKWGKYLRAPDIFFKILEKGKGKLVPLKHIAEVKRGFTTGANEFFYLTEEEIKRRGIEREFWMHPIPCSVAIPMATQTHQDTNYTPPYKTWGKSRSLRLKDFNYASPGVTYHITIGAFQKQSIFTKPSINQLVINTLNNSAKLYGYKLIAYCLMPDHLHILVQAVENPKDLRKFVRGFKSYCSVATGSVATPVATTKKLWQRGFYEHILRKEENVADVAEYIMNNPVRKGLVQDRGQYRWCELMMEVERHDRSHDATENDCSVASPDATYPIDAVWKDEGGKYFLRSQYKDTMKLEDVLIDDSVIWVPNYVIKSPRECKSIVVKPQELKYRVLMINKDKKALRGTNILKYIRDGERKGYHLRPTCASRERWYDLGKKEPGAIGWPYMLRERIFGALNESFCFLDCEFFDVYPRHLPTAMVGILNSSFFNLMVEMLSRSYGGGGGPLKIQVYELMEMPIPNIILVSNTANDKIEKAILKISKRPIESVFFELGASKGSVATPVATDDRPDRSQDATEMEVSLDKVKPDRRELDRIIMGEILGLTDEEQLEVYRAVVDLVKSRIEKAKSFGKRRKTKEGIDIDLLVKTVLNKLGDETLGKFYQDKILIHKPLSTRSLPAITGEIKLEQDLFGWRLSWGKRHISCASELEGRYLKVWLEAGLDRVKMPKDDEYLKDIVPQLENLKRKTDEVFDNYLSSIINLRIRHRLLHQLWQEVTKEARSA